MANRFQALGQLSHGGAAAVHAIDSCQAAEKVWVSIRQLNADWQEAADSSAVGTGAQLRSREHNSGQSTVAVAQCCCTAS